MGSTAHRPQLVLALVLVTVASLAAAASSRDKTQDAGLRDDLVSKIIVKLYTRRNNETGEVLDVNGSKTLKSSFFDSSLPTKILVHGWLAHQRQGSGGWYLKDALLEGHNFNVILVDWSAIDSINYIEARLRVQKVGEHIGQLIKHLVKEKGLDIGALHLIGHSLGAHIMGFAGRTAGLGNQGEGRITALDPAGPLFWNDANVRLDKTDAGFVDVIHTCGGYLGYWDPIGHADFYPNGGTWSQAGCGFSDFGGGCSHCRSYSLLLESIETTGSFIGTKCTSWQGFQAGECDGNAKAEMGLGCDTNARGSFYLRTTTEPPYSKTSGKPATDRQKVLQNTTKC